MLSMLETGETIYTYLAVSHAVISSTLIRKVETQHPIYYLSRILVGPEIQHTKIDKYILSMINT